MGVHGCSSVGSEERDEEKMSRYYGVNCDSTFTGVGIIWTDGELCDSEYFESDGSVTRRRTKVRETSTGRTYIERTGRKWYMDEFIGK